MSQTHQLLDDHIIAEAKLTMKNKFPIIIEYFFEDSAAYIRHIKEAILLSNPQKIISPAHTLKSSSLQVGAIELSQIAKSLEFLAREYSTNENKSDMSNFHNLFDQLEKTFTETAVVYPKL